MNRFRLLAAVGIITLGLMSIAGSQSKTTKTTAKPLTKAQEKVMDTVPTWLAGKYTGYSSYMKCSYELSIAPNGLVFARTEVGGKKSNGDNGRYHRNALIIAHKIYGVNRRDFGIEIVNEGNPRDTVDLKKG